MTGRSGNSATGEKKGASSATLRRSWRRFARTYLPRVTGCFLGLVVVRLWIQCCLYDRYGATDFGMYTVVGNLTRVLFIVLLMVVFSRIPLEGRRERQLAWLSVIFMTLAAVLHLVQLEFPALDLRLGASALAGMGIAWGGGMWIRFFVRLDDDEAFFYTFLCLGLSSAAGFFLGLLPPEAVFAMGIFLPALSLACFWQAMDDLDEREAFIPESPCDKAYDAQAASPLLRLLVGVAVLEFAVGIARGFPAGESIALPVGLQAVHQFGVLAVCLGLIALVLVFGRGVTFTGLWWAEVLTMVVGVMLIVTMDGPLMLGGAVLITLANTLIVGVLWYCAYDFSRHSSIPCYMVLGALWIAHLLPRELGRQLMLSFGDVLGSSLLLTATLVCLLSLSMLFVLPGKRLLVRPLLAQFPKTDYRERLQGAEGDGATAAEFVAIGEGPAAANMQRSAGETTESSEVLSAEDPEQSLKERCRQLRERYDLTEREADMAFYLAQGRSKAYIGQKLFISENTVKSYTRGLYQKVGVHSKQELLDALGL